MNKKILILALISMAILGVSQNAAARAVTPKLISAGPALAVTGPVFESPDGPTVNANALDVSKKMPAMCESYFDGCNSCFQNEDGIAGCTEMWCEVNEEPKCTKRRGYEEDKTPYYIKLNLDKTSCKSTDGGIYNGDDRCYFKRPKVYSLAEIQNMADYDNGSLRVDLSKENCEKNGGLKTIDGNGIEVCFLDLEPANFDECTGMYGKTTKSIPAQCSINGKVFIQDIKDVYQNNLSDKEKDIADNFDKAIDKKVEGLSDRDKNEYKTKLKDRIEKIVNFVEDKYKGLFLYIKESL